MKKVIFKGIAGAAILIAACVVMAQSVPQLINYQGRLTNSAGQPINGSREMHFALLDGDSASANVLWGETQASVQVNQGNYSILLGSVNPISASAFSGATVYLEVRVTGETLRPRQRIASAAYSLRADQADNAANLGGQAPSSYAGAGHNHNSIYYTKAQVDAAIAAAVADLQAQITAQGTRLTADEAVLTAHGNTLAAHETRLTADEAIITAHGNTLAAHETRLSADETELTDHETRLTADETTLADHETRLTTDEINISNLQGRMATLETILQPVTVLLSGSMVTDFIFTGVNVHVRSGSGATDGAINGKGNLIVGYNEYGSSPRTGSHNLVIGALNGYSSYGGLVAGFWNTISGPYASVSGGLENEASGDMSSISGGGGCLASGMGSSVSGGSSNTASGEGSSVSGGSHNEASFRQTSISGGSHNIASGYAASVSGGEENEASADASAILGGNFNVTDYGGYATVSGGISNLASGYGASVAGGSNNTASGDVSIVVGGSGNNSGGGKTIAGNYLIDDIVHWIDENTNNIITNSNDILTNSQDINSLEVRIDGCGCP